jgi:hypothetical protein
VDEGWAKCQIYSALRIKLPHIYIEFAYLKNGECKFDYLYWPKELTIILYVVYVNKTYDLYKGQYVIFWSG